MWMIPGFEFHGRAFERVYPAVACDVEMCDVALALRNDWRVAEEPTVEPIIDPVAPTIDLVEPDPLDPPPYRFRR